MNTKVHHVLFATTLLVGFAACGDSGPTLEGDAGLAETGETGKELYAGCRPVDEVEQTTSFTCQGEGAGWLVTDVYGAGKHNPITSCLAYADGTIPEDATAEDCAAIPLELIPFGIPRPSACCGEGTQDDSINNICELDCGYAACKTAIAAIRATADALAPTDGVPQGVIDTSKADLNAYADLLDAPASLQYCAKKVSIHAGEVTSIALGSGVSSPAAFGHINEATIFLGCSLDPDEPFVIDPDGGECTEPTNIPEAMQEQHSGGTVNGGAVTVVGPGVATVATIADASFEVHEVLNRDLSIDFTLSSFDATVTDTSAGSFDLRDVQVSLARPASGRLEGDQVTFAPGTLRFIVSAVVSVDGEPLFGGLPSRAEYSNSAPATATRSLDGSFAFVDAPFEAGAYTAVLNTEPSTLAAIQ
ncbi:hypothetical protein [Enhygromyxa salina]|uniref:Lipoprotein n=1 Tax=Enhygromyxa salina TaxID=215803 RepID=A0A2S9XPX9_9BACT|nr:hypothetical protein [Enhygromyxa salina]PRP94800.1 hypothetical protein ENSA7_76230 [Enhygromyxa salina]